jgi:16S rRNA U516 pseudouridylate synthase RsuA-like enzyme
MDELEHPVQGLARTAFGGIRVAGLRAGAVRALTTKEVKALYRQVDM